MKEKLEESLAGLKAKQSEYVKVHGQKVQELRNLENELNQINGAIALAQTLLKSEEQVPAEVVVDGASVEEGVQADEQP